MRIRLLHLFVSFLSLYMTLFAGAAFAQDKVTFAFFSREWPPFEIDVDGKPMGAAVDLFHELMPDRVDTVVDMMPAPRSVLHAPGGQIFTRIECQKWMKNVDNYLWSDPVLTIKTVLYSSAKKPVEYTGDKSLYGMKIGCIRNYFYPEVQPLFDSGKAERYDVNDDVLLLRMLKAGRVDVAVFDDVSAGWLIREASDLQTSDFHVSERVLGSAELRFVFNMHSGWKERLSEINDRIRKKRADGVIDEIMARYK